jgi:trimethylamine:corrinoid methyltransferase-like protein
LYQTDPVIDRTTRDSDATEPAADLVARAAEQVEQRLARYRPVATDPVLDGEMRRLVLDGMDQQDTLPDVPSPPEASAPEAPAGRRGRRSRRRRG